MEDSILKTVILPASLALIMFGMGLSLTLADFKRIFQAPKAVFLGAFSQLIILPLVAFGLLEIFGYTGSFAVGLIIIAACPGGATSNIITHVSKGDTALSVTLTAISSIVTIFSIPFLVNFALSKYTGSESNITLPLKDTVGALFIITLIPVGVGMLVRRLNSGFAIKADKVVRVASIIIFVAILAALILKNKQHLADYFEKAGIISLVLNVVTMGLGYLLAVLLKLSRKQAITISIEAGIQNGTLALVVVALITNAPADTVIIPAIYSLVMFFTGGFMMAYFGRKSKNN